MATSRHRPSAAKRRFSRAATDMATSWHRPGDAGPPAGCRPPRGSIPITASPIATSKARRRHRSCQPTGDDYHSHLKTRRPRRGETAPPDAASRHRPTPHPAREGIQSFRRMIPARPTMNDVAREAGVSLKTVSRVVNGEEGVRLETVERVDAAISRLQYRRNDIASTLRRRTNSASIGLVIEDLANPFYSLAARAIEDAASTRGSMLITGSSEGSPELERRLVGTLVVFLDRPPMGIEADSVVLDSRGGARTAVSHLLAQGHRRVAIVGDREGLWTASERLAGYREALAKAGVGVDAALVRLGSHAVGDAESITKELLHLPSPPTAIFAANNRNCIGVLRAVGSERRRLRPGGAWSPGGPAPLLPDRRQRRPCTAGRPLHSHDPARLRGGRPPVCHRSLISHRSGRNPGVRASADVPRTKNGHLATPSCPVHAQKSPQRATPTGVRPL